MIRFLKNKNLKKMSLDKNRYYRLPLIIALLASSVFVMGQTQPNTIKMGKKAELLSEIDKGVVWMDKGYYEKADERFNYVLNNMEVIPANLAFYVGKNSLFLKKYKQSIDWLNKYIQLKGTKGQYYFESVKLLAQAELEYNKLKNPQVKRIVKIDSVLNNHKIDCGPSGMVVCPVCKGKSVIIETGPLGSIYRPCPYSDESGFLTCEEYNLLLQGKLKAKF